MDRLNYSSDAIKLRLAGHAFAFSDITIAIGGEPGEWDYITLESPDGERGAWEWVSGRDTMTLKVKACGTYRLRYFIEGGFFVTGTPVECLDVAVWYAERVPRVRFRFHKWLRQTPHACKPLFLGSSPVRSFEVDECVAADSPINIAWQLSFNPEVLLPVCVPGVPGSAHGVGPAF